MMDEPVDSRDKVEIGRLATWSVSSAKTGHGLGRLRDSNLDTYWQSDGPQPHFVNMQFEKKTAVQQVSFYTDFKQDESYTPQHISIRAGTTHHDLKELATVDLEAITGWTTVNLEDFPGSGRPPRVFLLQLAVISNQLGGRDTHLRQLRLHTAREYGVIHSVEFLNVGRIKVYSAKILTVSNAVTRLLLTENEQMPFTAPEFLHFSILR